MLKKKVAVYYFLLSLAVAYHWKLPKTYPQPPSPAIPKPPTQNHLIIINGVQVAILQGIVYHTHVSCFGMSCYSCNIVQECVSINLMIACCFRAKIEQIYAESLTKLAAKAQKTSKDALG